MAATLATVGFAAAAALHLPFTTTRSMCVVVHQHIIIAALTYHWCTKSAMKSARCAALQLARSHVLGASRDDSEASINSHVHQYNQVQVNQTESQSSSKHYKIGNRMTQKFQSYLMGGISKLEATCVEGGRVVGVGAVRTLCSGAP